MLAAVLVYALTMAGPQLCTLCTQVLRYISLHMHVVLNSSGQPQKTLKLVLQPIYMCTRGDPAA